MGLGGEEGRVGLGGEEGWVGLGGVSSVGAGRVKTSSLYLSKASPLNFVAFVATR